MQIVSIDSIQISPNRQRRDFDLTLLNELAESIQSIGLMHPLVVREEGEQLILVAGERRLRAIKDIYDLGGTVSFNNIELPTGNIPVSSLGELNELEREEAELEENIRRTDLSWQESAEATARLSMLRTGQAAAKGAPVPTTAAIALEVRGSAEGVNQETTRRELIVAKHLADPEVRAAKTVNDAYKLLKRKEAATKNAQLAATVGRTFSSSSHSLVNADALKWIIDAKTGEYDIILTDPPYGMGADEFGDSGGRAAGAHGYADSVEIFKQCLDAGVSHFLRITKPEAHLYWFCDIDKFHESRAAFEAAGWWVHRTPLIWHKLNGERVPWPEHGPQRKYELILYAVKGKKKVTHIYPDIIAAASDKNLGHGAQKPVAVYQNLLQRSAHPGAKVLDPFCGTGPLLPAAHQMKCYATCVEVDPSAYGIAVQRLKDLDAEPELAGL